MNNNIVMVMVLLCGLSLIWSGCRRSGEQPANLPPAEPVEQSSVMEEAKTTSMTAVFHTSMGKITCELFPEEAPVTVENFISLARGTKEWTDPASGKKVTCPLYNDTLFHRVIPEFMIQGGDPLGKGVGGPGYEFKDEISGKLKFDRPGILAMANAGPNTNGSQFFITVAPTPWLDGHHTIFGRVISGQEVVDAISRVERDRQDSPLKRVLLNKVEILEKK